MQLSAMFLDSYLDRTCPAYSVRSDRCARTLHVSQAKPVTANPTASLTAYHKPSESSHVASPFVTNCRIPYLITQLSVIFQLHR